jgi:hypothetical protein
MRRLPNVVWTCMVCHADSRWLEKYLRAVAACDPGPRELLLVNNDHSPLIEKIAQESVPGFCRHEFGDVPNQGWHASFNQAARISNSSSDSSPVVEFPLFRPVVHLSVRVVE